MTTNDLGYTQEQIDWIWKKLNTPFFECDLTANWLPDEVVVSHGQAAIGDKHTSKFYYTEEMRIPILPRHRGRLMRIILEIDMRAQKAKVRMGSDDQKPRNNQFVREYMIDEKVIPPA